MINAAVEGLSDEGVARAVIRAAGHEVGKVFAKGGKTRLDPLIPNYNRAALHEPWVVFRDSDTKCPVELRAQLLQGIDVVSPSFALRIVHPMTEAWLLADRERFAEFFGVRTALVPSGVDSLQNAKATVLHLCSRSRSKVLRADMVTEGGKTGPLYVSRVNEFAEQVWRVGVAAVESESLDRALVALRALA